MQKLKFLYIRRFFFKKKFSVLERVYETRARAYIGDCNVFRGFSQNFQPDTKKMYTHNSFVSVHLQLRRKKNAKMRKP